jgi:hypothetical protein
MDENKIDEEFLTSEELLDIFRKAFDSCIKTRHRKRIKLNYKILIGAILVDNQTDTLLRIFSLLFSDITPTDIIVGLEIYKQQRNRPLQFDIESKENTELNFIVRNGWHELQNLCKFDEVDFKISLHKLSTSGLIKEIVGMYGNYTEGLYLITPTLQRLTNFI